ncbi:MAG: hypothetical protein KA340_08120 [Saprospiraceae bacterium]|nr:hypothetical protein [Saprospiraceae bacterium]
MFIELTSIESLSKLITVSTAHIVCFEKTPSGIKGNTIVTLNAGTNAKEIIVLEDYNTIRDMLGLSPTTGPKADPLV